MSADGHLRVELSPQRLGRITGSRLAAALRCDPYKTRDEVLRDMVRQFHGLPDLFTGNEYTDWGHEHEPDAIAAYEKWSGQVVHGAQDIVVHPFYDFLAATPDGLVGEHGMVECKCPFRARYKSVWERRDYEMQCRLQMECSGRRWVDFVIWRLVRGKPVISVDRVEYDPAWLPSVLPKLQAFMADYERLCQDEEYVAIERGRGVAVEVTDQREQLVEDLTRWRELSRSQEQIEAELVEIKERVSTVLGTSELATIDGQPVARMQYRQAASVFDRAAFRKAYADLEAEFSKPGKPSRYPVRIEEKESA